MKNICMKTFCCLCAVCIVFGLSSCSDKNDTDTTSGTYVYHPSGENTETASENTSSSQSGESIPKNDSWKENFDLSYTYFNTESSSARITVREKRSDNCFTAEDTASGETLFYCQNGADIDSYIIVPGEDEQIHSVISGKTLADLSSTFMKLAEVDAGLPSLSNVLYMQDEDVAGRACAKYIQRAYEGGALTKTVYVWVDKEYGFAARGEVFDAADELTASWELSSFTVGGVTDEDTRIDLSEYKIVEE